MARIFRPGTWRAVCAVCGFTYWSHRLKKRWDGVRVCAKCWEPRHSLDRVFSVAAERGLPWSQPGTPPAYLRPGSVNVGTNPSGDTVPVPGGIGWMVLEGPRPSPILQVYQTTAYPCSITVLAGTATVDVGYYLPQDHEPAGRMVSPEASVGGTVTIAGADTATLNGVQAVVALLDRFRFMFTTTASDGSAMGRITCTFPE